MHFDTSLALFQYLLKLDEQRMTENLSTLIDDSHAYFSDVMALIAAHEANKEQTAFNAIIGKQAEQLVDDNVIHELIGKQIGVYQLTKKLGQGGMGAVYLGERNDGQVNQKVAIKFVYPSIAALAGEDFLLNEAQHLANLSHAYITQMLTVDKTDKHLSYMVMEYVEGIPIDNFCKSNSLDLKARLELFLKVCKAVQFAHQNMIIHADIKPSNILVDVNGNPKLMDFGIARKINIAVRESEFAGNEKQQYLKAFSRDFASPEQLNNEKVSTLSDIFSLGKLLNVMMSHTQKPNREIEAIIQKAAATEDAYRYQNIQSLVASVNALFNHYPLDEYSNSPLYRATKFIKRNTAFSVSAMVFCCVVLGFILTLNNKNLRLTQQIGKSEQLSEFLISLMSAGDPILTQGRELKVRDLILSGVNKIDSELVPYSKEKHELKNTMALSLYNLGYFDESLDVLNKIDLSFREIPSDEVLQTLYNQAKAYRAKSEFDQAKELLQQLLQWNALVDEDSKQSRTIMVHQQLAEIFAIQDKMQNANDNIAIAIELFLREGQSALGIDVYTSAAQIALKQAKFAEAEQFIEQAETLLGQKSDQRQDIHSDVLTAAGDIFAAQSKWPQAAEKYRLSHQYAVNLYGEDHPVTAMLSRNIGFTSEMLGEFDIAISSYQAALTISERHHGKYSVEVAEINNDLGIVNQTVGNYDKAIQYYQQAMFAYEQTLGKDSVETATTLSNIATVYADKGEYEKEIELYIKSIEVTEKVFGRKHPKIAIRLASIAQSYIDQKKYLQAKPFIEESVAISFEVLGEQHKRTADHLLVKANLLTALGEYQQAHELLLKTKDIFVQIQHTENHIAVAATYNSLGLNALKNNKPMQSVEYLEKAINSAENSVGEDHKRTHGFRANLAHAFIVTGQKAQAQQMLSKLISYYNSRKELSEHPDKQKVDQLYQCLNSNKRCEI